MDIITIFEVLKKYGLVALTAVVAFTVLLGTVYFIYKKLFHGTKTFSKGQWITTMLLLGWFVVVLGLTMLNRGANYMEKINFALFSGYKNAWNEWSGTEYQLIIFNMLMFFPLGLLVPFLTKKGEKLSVVFCRLDGYSDRCLPYTAIWKFALSACRKAKYVYRDC